MQIIKDERCLMKKPNKGKTKLNQGLNSSFIEMHAKKVEIVEMGAQGNHGTHQGKMR